MRLCMALALTIACLGACSGKSKAPAAPASGVGSGSGSSVANRPVSPYPTKPTGPATAPLSSAPGVKVTLADVGLEQASLDRTVDPCVDFYQFTCGGWLANNQIPADRARWGRSQEVDERNRTAIKALLEEAAKGISADVTTKKLGDYYASCMDEATIDRAGMAAIKSLADKARIKDAKGWMSAVTELHKVGRSVVWSADADADPKDPSTAVIYLDVAAAPVEPITKPQVAKLLAFAGTPAARVDAAAGDVIAIETDLAKLRGAETAAVEPKALAKQTKAIDWKAYWKALGVDPGKKLVVRSPKLFASVDKLRAKYKPAQWASYFTFHLASAFVDLPGEPEKPAERSRYCVDATARALGDAIGQQYASKYFTMQAKQTATTLVDALARAVGDEITRVDWLTDAARAAALAKLTKQLRMIGYPERWRSYDFDVKREDFAGNTLRAGAFDTQRRLARAGKPIDRNDWETPAFSIDPVYDPLTTTAVLPAGVLQPPFFGQDRSVGANLGGLAMLFGSELTKGFVEHGSAIEPRAKCIEAQYSGFEAMPKGFVNGKLTLHDNIADLGGAKMAFKAYRGLRKDAAKVYVADGYTEDQQFFIAVGQAWCTRDRPAELAKRLQSDPHAPAKFRVYGSLRNMKEFSEAFSCAPGTPMNPAKSCSVW